MVQEFRAALVFRRVLEQQGLVSVACIRRTFPPTPLEKRLPPWLGGLPKGTKPTKLLVKAPSPLLAARYSAAPEKHGKVAAKAPVKRQMRRTMPRANGTHHHAKEACSKLERGSSLTLCWSVSVAKDWPWWPMEDMETGIAKLAQLAGLAGSTGVTLAVLPFGSRNELVT